MKRPKVFISYSHKDETWKNQVVTQLGVLAKDAQLDIWDDRRIAGGDDWLPEIETAIQSCDVALILISADFLTSNFILSKEVPLLLQRRANEGVQVIPVILRPSPWTAVSWLKGIQARPRDGKPLSSLTIDGAEEALAALAVEVVKSAMDKVPESPGAVIAAKSPTRLIEINLDTDLANFGLEQQKRFLDSVANLLSIADVTIKQIRPGSVKVTLELRADKVEQLRSAVQAGHLKAFCATGAELVDECRLENAARSTIPESSREHDLDSTSTGCSQSVALADFVPSRRKKDLDVEPVRDEHNKCVTAFGARDRAAWEENPYPPSRLRHGADSLFGREQELAVLDQAWNNPAQRILTVVAWGGVGKTSLVVEWMARKASTNWPSIERVFDWSFYSQGTREQSPASADSFIAAALAFFGDAVFAQSACAPWDKGARLAQLVAERRTLLVLDGLESLQHPPGTLAGQLRDPALAALVRGLVQHNPGLCVITTRERLTDLAPFTSTTAPVLDLQQLSVPAGMTLLKTFGVCGTEAEFQRLVEDVCGHALTLNLLSRYLVKAHEGDIRRCDQVNFEKADARIQGGHAFKTMTAYEKWLASGGEEGARQLAALRLLGLFDRPADLGSLMALRRKPAIPGLTEPLLGLREDDWNLTLSSLADCGLISVQKESVKFAESQPLVDVHHLVRDYFATHLRRDNNVGWISAHRRLFEHLEKRTEQYPETIEALVPLYEAIAHGCEAGLYRRACDDVFNNRIRRGTQCYSTRQLGAFGAELSALNWFFEEPWTKVVPLLAKTKKAWLLNQAAFCLRALGRLRETLDPIRTAVEWTVTHKDWLHAAISSNNLVDMELLLGQVNSAVRDAERGIEFTKRQSMPSWLVPCFAVLAHAMHQSGQRDKAEQVFQRAEANQANVSSFYLLHNGQGFDYCDLLLAGAERSAWCCFLGLQPRTPRHQDAICAAIARCNDIEKRAATTCRWEEVAVGGALYAALDTLTLGRAALYRMILNRTVIQHSEDAAAQAGQHLNAALERIRGLGRQDYIPLGLLVRAWFRFLKGDTDGARADLDEAFQIAERGPMRLLLADIHLCRARIFRDKEELNKARAMIEHCGYWRRKQELEDAENAAEGW